MTRTGSPALAIAAAAAAAALSACGNPNANAVEPYDLPVKVEGGIEEADVVKSAPLTITVESVEADEGPDGEATPTGEDLRGAVETAIAFEHYSDLKSCESTASGWESSFDDGTIALAFTLLPEGAIEDVSVALTTGGPSEAFVSCLVGIVSSMTLTIEGAALEEATPFHLFLRYGS